MAERKIRYSTYKDLKDQINCVYSELSDLEGILIDCYENLIDLYGSTKEDEITHFHERERLSFTDAKRRGEALKERIRNKFVV